MQIKDIPVELKKINTRIEILEKIKFYNYETNNKYIPTIGYVSEIYSLRECAKALNFIKTKCINELQAAQELGLELQEIEEDTNYLGFKFEIWKNDISLRVEELKNKSTLEKLLNAKNILLKYRSKEDTLINEVENINLLLNSI